jgi:hypothetical protein
MNAGRFIELFKKNEFCSLTEFLFFGFAVLCCETVINCLGVSNKINERVFGKFDGKFFYTMPTI